jgi:hypothetical protein
MLGVVLCASLSAREYHVSKKGNDRHDGSRIKPFLTISRAVQCAMPGDTITVHAGNYREWVNPIRGGENDNKRIVYRAAPGEHVEIKGSEVIKNWKYVKGGVWKVTLPERFFGDYNPYRDLIFGDWFNDYGRIHHTGEVFLNGKSLYEKETIEKVFDPVPDTSIMDPEGSIYTWYCESDDKRTTIWANFHDRDPNKELTEISVRRTCFYPENPGINYITISGFHFSQAATQWPAPTAEQVGLISTHWNKGWIIENNVIHDSKCAGITLGKERGTGHNVWSSDLGSVYNDGNVHYIEVLFRVLRNGWNKEQIGSHIVRNNTIFNCEQAGICGTMGAAFSVIENNHIYDIWTKRQFGGDEIGGIKLHAPIDVLIRNNRIHNTVRGLWLDWMTQGTRVSGNLLYDNDRVDVYFEVNHGPFVADNNVLLSPNALITRSQGGAFIHNLFGGMVITRPDHRRFTPYFLPNSTDVAGLSIILAGDDRYYNNIFIGTGENSDHGLSGYDNTRLPNWIEGNVYYKGAQPSAHDEHFLMCPDHDPELLLEEKDNAVYLSFDPGPRFTGYKARIVSGDILGEARIPKAPFTNPDGGYLMIDTDYFGNKRISGQNVAGPFLDLPSGITSLMLWQNNTGTTAK